ncbi:MAG: phosphotransferase [Deltaproteobacteria bacterium]|nr:phosphotransferase [Deltaproteobacteria bacterium]
MAILTPVSLDDAERVTRAHGLGPCLRVTGIEAGSVNSNFFLDTGQGRRFLRLYEEQEAAGVAYEWALLEHLLARGLAVPRRVRGPAPGDCRVSGKCTALFEIAPGEEHCAAMWTRAHLEQAGRFLGRAHTASAHFGWRRRSRFGNAGLLKRLDGVAERRRPELEAPLRRLRRHLQSPEQAVLGSLPRGIVHGDFFRDNLRFEQTKLVCVLDWESAADEPLIMDLVVALLALTYGEDFVWADARALVDGYRDERELSRQEWLALRPVAMQACVRFAITRIQDFHLRALATGIPATRDFKRFLARLDALEALSDAQLATRLGG